MQFKVRRILNNNIKNEIEKIGFSRSYLDFGALKHDFLNIKIYNLKPPAASIIKQTALSKGIDAAVSKGVIDCSIEKTDVILSGSLDKLSKTAESLIRQQFSLPIVSKEILKQIELYKESKKPVKPLIMGILNVTEDSFSDGGEFLNPENAIEHALQMVNDGAKIIDTGAESTRPGAKPVDTETEIKRLTPVIKKIKNCGAKISIDTRNALTARKMAELGADIINDVSGLTYDKDMAKTVKETGLEVVITHSRGVPSNMEGFCSYKNVVDEVYFELLERVENALREGVQPEKIIIDPGFGFAKNVEQNFELLQKVEEFKSMGFKVLVGVSRKGFLKSLVTETVQQDDTIKTLDNLTSCVSTYLGLKNIDIIRVHNVAKTRMALDLAEHIKA